MIIKDPEHVTFQINNHEGVGPLRFGMSRVAVQEALGSGFKTFKRTPESINSCDYFPEFHCFVYYDVSDNVEAVEFVRPAEVTMGGLNLLGFTFADLIKQVTSQDPEVVVRSDGFTSVNLGLGCHAPSAGDVPASLPESVIVFARGYYN